jgi:plasmid stability protein
MEQQDEKRSILAVELDPDLKRWIELKAAERIIEGRPHGERSMGAVIRDILTAALEAEKAVAA